MNVRISFEFGGIRFQYADSQVEPYHVPGGFPRNAELHRYLSGDQQIKLTSESVCAHVNRGEFSSVEVLEGEPVGCGCGCGEEAKRSPEQLQEQSEQVPEKPQSPPKRPKKRSP